MLEVLVGVWSGVNVACIALIWWRMEKNAILLRHEIAEAASNLKSLDLNSSLVDDVRDEINDAIEGAIGNMRTPQLADHLGAILSQWAQIKMAKEMQTLQGSGELVEAVD